MPPPGHGRTAIGAKSAPIARRSTAPSHFFNVTYKIPFSRYIFHTQFSLFSLPHPTFSKKWLPVMRIHLMSSLRKLCGTQCANCNNARKESCSRQSLGRSGVNRQSFVTTSGLSNSCLRTTLPRSHGEGRRFSVSVLEYIENFSCALLTSCQRVTGTSSSMSVLVAGLDYRRYKSARLQLRKLSYLGASNMFDEYLLVADTTGRECLNYFCKGVIETFGATYLRSPTLADSLYLFDLHEGVHGFLGMLGSIDCMHWLWSMGELCVHLERSVHD